MTEEIANVFNNDFPALFSNYCQQIILFFFFFLFYTNLIFGLHFWRKRFLWFSLEESHLFWHLNCRYTTPTHSAKKTHRTALTQSKEIFYNSERISGHRQLCHFVEGDLSKHRRGISCKLKTVRYLKCLINFLMTTVYGRSVCSKTSNNPSSAFSFNVQTKYFLCP